MFAEMMVYATAVIIQVAMFIKNAGIPGTIKELFPATIKIISVQYILKTTSTELQSISTVLLITVTQSTLEC